MSSRFVLPFADVGSGIKPPSGALLFFLETDSSGPKDTFSDQLSTPTVNANPVVADSTGVFPDIFITGIYKVVLQNKNGSQIWEADPVGELGIGTSENSIPFIFDTVSDMTSSLLIFPIGKALATKGYSTVGDGAQAEYVIVAPQAADEFGDHTLTNSNVAVLQEEEGTLKLAQYSVDGTADDSTAIQSALDKLDAIGLGKDVIWPQNVRIDNQVVLPFPGHYRMLSYGCTIDGRGTEAVAGHGTSVLAYQGSSITGSMIIQGIFFDGTNAGTNLDAIWTNPKGSLYVVRDCHFEFFRHQFVEVDYIGGGGANNQASNMHIETSEFRQASDAAVIYSRADAPSFKDSTIKDGINNAIEIGQTAISNRSFLGSLLTGQTTIAEIDGNTIEANMGSGVKIYNGRGTKINSDFEINGTHKLTLTGITGTFTAGEILTFGTSGNIGTTVKSFSGSTLITGRAGDFNSGETVTGNDSGATATISVKSIDTWQIDCMESVAGGGDFKATIGASKLSGVMPQIRARQGTRITADIKETGPECPGIVVPLEGEICDARGTMYGDNVNRFGDGTLLNGGVGGIITGDSIQTYNIRSFTPPIDGTGVRMSSVFNLDDNIIMIINASIMDDTTNLPAPVAEFYIRNVTDNLRVAGFGNNVKWIVPVLDNLDIVARDTEFGNYSDGNYDVGDDYVIYIRQTSGSANALTGHFTVQLIPFKS